MINKTIWLIFFLDGTCSYVSQGIMVAEQLLNDPALFARATAIGAFAAGPGPSAEELVDEYLAHCGWAATKKVWNMGN